MHVGRVDEGDADKVGQDGQQVNDVHRALHELELARTRQKADLQKFIQIEICGDIVKFCL